MRLTLLLAVLSWIAMVLVDLALVFGEQNDMVIGVPQEASRFLLILYFISLFYYFNQRIKRFEDLDFINLLWKVFATGLVTTIIAFVIKMVLASISTSRLGQDAVWVNLLYHINIGLVSIYLISTFVVWKELILYQRSTQLIKRWNLFEYALLIGMFLVFFVEPYSSEFIISLTFLFLFGLFQSVNLKWVPYLNFKQKWQAVLLVLLASVYLYFFFDSLIDYSKAYPLINDLLDNAFILALFSFIFLYSVFSLLVILFNLPTSSVFEQKLVEALNFQRLSQSIQAGQSEEQVYDILIDSSMSAVYADAGWLEIYSSGDDCEFQICKSLSKEEASKTRKVLTSVKSMGNLLQKHELPTKKEHVGATLRDSSFKSVLIFPIQVNKSHIGNLVLLKEVKDGFNKEMINIVSTFVSQASISVENYELLSEALVNERYKEELKIAKRVQRALLPDQLHHNDSFEIVAFSEAADEVGGDYYETYNISDDKYALILGDVSGKGTSAAFNMSQMKGVFHSLSPLKLDVKDFLKYANQALGSCLEKHSFITVAYFIIDTAKQEMEFGRAGQCPSLFYEKKTERAFYFDTKGMALGMVRNEHYEQYIHVNKQRYEAGDVLVLYTDGIIEARNSQKEEFGMDRLAAVLQEHAEKSAEEIKDKLMEAVYTFCEGTHVDDDYSLVIVKFI